MAGQAARKVGEAMAGDEAAVSTGDGCSRGLWRVESWSELNDNSA